ncbi:MAG: aspartate--tRNA(Asn) ligase [Planctomycetaceae bacterium]|nr:aspartate--tRNA(Asn) ligase [Planctomycetaceae bacterium]
MATSGRIFIAELGVGEQGDSIGGQVLIRGWAKFVRKTKSTTFIVLQDASGTVQCVGSAQLPVHVKREDALEIVGKPRKDERAKPLGFEVDIVEIRVIGVASESLPFPSGGNDIAEVGIETVLDYRPLSLRTDRVGTIFRIQAALVEGFREALRKRRFTEIITSKIVGGGTEGGANLFAIQYFDRVAYLAQSPQFYKEHGVLGFERVFETGHVYRAEPHATSRHLTEYYSLDFEMGFIDGPEDIIQVEREALTEIFETIKQRFEKQLAGFESYLPSMMNVPTWTFDAFVERLAKAHGRTDLIDDLNPEAERQLCTMAEQECGVAAVFVIGYPMSARPFYTHPRGDTDRAAGFDLLFRGLEITTGGQRLHTRTDLEAALRAKGVDPTVFEPHLKMFELGMPPHGGLAIGLERLTAQILGLKNIREATMYPRDMNRLSP